LTLGHMEQDFGEFKKEIDWFLLMIFGI
jgi:hypothetical protein